LKALVGSHSETLGDSRVADILTIAVDVLDPDAESLAIKEAQRLWARYFGACRASPCASTATFKKNQNSTTSSSSEAQWLRARRVSIDHSAHEWLRGGKQVGSKDRIVARGSVIWTDKMAAEQEFQRKKRFTRLVYAERQGHILTGDIPDQQDHERQRSALETRERKARQARQLKAKSDNLATNFSMASFPFLAGKQIFLDKSLVAAETKSCAVALKKAKATVAHTRSSADIFVVRDVVSLGQRLDWFAILGGRMVATGEYLTSGGIRGQALSYGPAYRVRRRIWASPNFADNHATLHGIIDHFVQLPLSRWTWFVGSIDEYLAAAVKQKHGAQRIIAVVTPSDKSNVMAGPETLTYIP
jgi:hypothetical protein